MSLTVLTLERPSCNNRCVAESCHHEVGDEMMATANKRTLYVGGLDRQVTEEMLYAAFVPFGPLKLVQVPMDPATRVSKGFGFVEFDEEEDARAAIDNMDDSELFGKTLRVTIAKPDRPKLGSNRPIWAATEVAEDAAPASEEPM